MMKPVKLLFVVLGLMVANPLFAADASNYSEDYSQPEEYGAEDDYTDNSAADYTATDYTDSEQYNYDQSEDTSDATGKPKQRPTVKNWPAMKIRAFVKPICRIAC